jgi:hypothetical protein
MIISHYCWAVLLYLLFCYIFYFIIYLSHYCWAVSFIICMLTFLLMPSAGLLFCVGLDFVTPSLQFDLSKHHHHHYPPPNTPNPLPDILCIACSACLYSIKLVHKCFEFFVHTYAFLAGFMCSA